MHGRDRGMQVAGGVEVVPQLVRLREAYVPADCERLNGAPRAFSAERFMSDPGAIMAGEGRQNRA